MLGDGQTGLIAVTAGKAGDGDAEGFQGVLDFRGYRACAAEDVDVFDAPAVECLFGLFIEGTIAGEEDGIVQFTCEGRDA